MQHRKRHISGCQLRTFNTHHRQLVHQLPFPLQAAVEPEAPNPNERKSEVTATIARRHPSGNSSVRAVQAQNDDRDIRERIDKLGNVLLSEAYFSSSHSCSGSLAHTSLPSVQPIVNTPMVLVIRP